MKDKDLSEIIQEKSQVDQDGLEPGELEEFRNLISHDFIPQLLTIADKYDIDRDSMIKYTADMFVVMAEIATFENYKTERGKCMKDKDLVEALRYNAHVLTMFANRKHKLMVPSEEQMVINATTIMFKAASALEMSSSEKPNKLGMWIERFDESGKWYECDQCHTDWGGLVNYCPHCGAKMSEMPTGSEGGENE